MKAPDSLLNDPLYKQAKTIALDRLAQRSRSRAELHESMRRKSIPDDLCEVVLQRLETAGLVNDAEFARSWVRARQSSKGLARRALAAELKHKGVDDHLIVEALGELDHEVERQTAHRLVQARLRRSDQTSDPKQVRRLTSMLARKGYPHQVAFDVVRIELGLDGPDSASIS